MKVFGTLNKVAPNKVNILTVLINKDRALIEKRIMAQKISSKYKEKRLHRLRNKVINPNDYDLIIDNHSSFQDLKLSLITNLVDIF